MGKSESVQANHTRGTALPLRLLILCHFCCNAIISQAPRIYKFLQGTVSKQESCHSEDKRMQRRSLIALQSPSRVGDQWSPLHQIPFIPMRDCLRQSLPLFQPVQQAFHTELLQFQEGFPFKDFTKAMGIGGPQHFIFLQLPVIFYKRLRIAVF